MEEDVDAVMIIEMLGKPAEHIRKTLSDVVDMLGKEKGARIVKSRIAEPKELKDNKELFTSFAEIEIKVELQTLMFLIFKYMPSHIEVLEPENLKIKSSELNLVLGELARKLHQYDEIANAVLIERQNLQQMIKDGKIKVEQEVTLSKPEKKRKVYKKK